MRDDTSAASCWADTSWSLGDNNTDSSSAKCSCEYESEVSAPHNGANTHHLQVKVNLMTSEVCGTKAKPTMSKISIIIF